MKKLFCMGGDCIWMLVEDGKNYCGAPIEMRNSLGRGFICTKEVQSDSATFINGHLVEWKLALNLE